MRILAHRPTIIDACFYFRVEVPLEFMRKHFNIEVDYVTDLENISSEQINRSDIFIFNRCFTVVGVSKWMNALKEEFKVVCDIDDYWILPKNHPSKKDWDRLDIDKAIVKSIRMADMVTTTNARLADKIKTYNKNIYIHNNYINPSDRQFSTYKTNSDKIRFGFMGSASHLHDLDLLTEPLKKLRETHGDKFKVIFGGYADTTICNEMVAKLGECELLPLKSVYEYGTMYQHIDVCLVPLHNNEFNSCKSDLKLHECAATNTIPVVSWAYPYLDNDVVQEMFCIYQDERTYYELAHLIDYYDENKIEASRQLHEFKLANNIYEDCRKRLEEFNRLLNG